MAERAIAITKVDFGVVQGGRTLDYQMQLYGKGRTVEQCAAMNVPARYAQPHEKRVTWINPRKGNHVVDASGLGSAIDVMPYVNGEGNWDNDGHLGLWPPIAHAMKQAAADLGISIRWGGDWAGDTNDRPHFELAK